MDVQFAASEPARIDTNAVPRLRPPWTLDGLIRPVPVQQFCDHYWGKLPLRIARHNPGFYRDLISAGEIEQYFSLDEFFARHSVATPSRDSIGADHPPNSASELYERLRQGCSLRLRRMECFMHPAAPTMSLLRAMEAALQNPKESLSCYITPAGAAGLGPHHDETEIFTLQISGSKRWRLFHRVDTDVPGLHEEKDLGPAVDDFELEAGDLLYVPGGLVHHVTNDVHSFSLTIVFRPFRWNAVLDLLMARLARTSPFMAPLPAGLLHTGMSDALRKEFDERVGIVRDSLAALDVETLLDELVPRHLLGMTIPPAERLTSLFEELTVDSWVERPADMTAHVIRTGDRVTLVLPGGYTLQADARAEAAFRHFLATTRPFRVADFHETLSPAAGLSLACKLVGCGLLRPLPAGGAPQDGRSD